MFFAYSVMYTDLQVCCIQLDSAYGRSLLVTMFVQFMLSDKIILSVESQETIIELSVHISTHKPYVNKIIYI
jgi:hypothetical protein